MDNEIKVWLFDIQNSIYEIRSYFDEDLDFEKYQNDIKTKRAVERNFEIIGEAVNRILKKDENFPITDSRKIIGLRNRIIHAYDFISDELIWSVLTESLPILEKEIDIYWVPGAFEIPLIAKKCGLTKKYDSIICLGAVIRGATSHYDYVCAEVSKGIASVSLELNLPIVFGVLTTDSIEQAIERAGTKSGNKGYDCGVSAIELANLGDIINV